MKFLDGRDATAEIKKHVDESKEVRMAVAFWGEGAAEDLGLLKKREAATVICNLKMGGTNPKEIRALMDGGVRVSQCDTLHGKVYLFDRLAIVGSSNASANGLSLQGTELSGWHEANLVSDNPDVYADASSWFDNLPAEKIEEKDLVAAEDAWSRRRRSARLNWPKDNLLPENATLIEALRKHPEKFMGKRIYLCAYSRLLDADGVRALEQKKRIARKSHEMRFDDLERLDCFQEWPELPDFADLVCFYVGPRGGAYFDGFCQMPETRQEFKTKETTIQLCWSKDDISDVSEVGSLNEWKPALLQFKRDTFGDDEGAFMDLGEFSKKYLHTRRAPLLQK
jgi:hypothetical protein